MKYNYERNGIVHQYQNKSQYYKIVEYQIAMICIM